MFWKNWSWSARILSALGLAILAAILFPVFARDRGYPHSRGCSSNLKQIGLGFMQYAQDYDEKFPLVITGGSAYGWADALQPYIKSTQLYQCPKDPDKGQSDPLQNGYIDYPFNVNLDHKPFKEIDNVASQIVLIEGNDGLEVTNARYCLTQIPPKWREDQNSPLHRHLEMGNYLFADGHVKAFPPTAPSTNKSLVF